MHAADEKPVELFNTLIGINNNRIECYKFAGKETDATTFRILFSRLAETSLICNEALITEVYKLGGVPYRATLASSDFFQNWLKVHSALMNNNSRELVEACTGAEEMVLCAYNETVQKNENILNSFQYNMLLEQIEMLKNDALRVNNLRSVFTTAA